jgi:hypothetical protein
MVQPESTADNGSTSNSPPTKANLQKNWRYVAAMPHLIPFLAPIPVRLKST